ncbi:MAG: zinc finger protein [Gammaproteobacteria bacterium]
MDEIFPAPRVFWWLPVAGQRHAIRECDRTAPTGEPVHTLCGTTHDRPAPPTDAEWLWRTCESCWNETCKIVDVRPRR